MPSGNKGRRGKRERGRDGHSDIPTLSSAAQASGDKRTPTTTDKGPALKLATNVDCANEEEEMAATVCWICAEPIKYYSLPACNHRTCHICALRLRALYEKVECTFCKEPQSMVIFTAFRDLDFSSYTLNVIPYQNSKLGIFFETANMMEETLGLLRFNCPSTKCGYTASGWPDLKLHARAVHKKMFCDLCIQNKKVFPHEHVLYPSNVLPLHLPSMPTRPRQQPLNETIEGGIHPLCAFCNECFFGDDELFVHMRDQHEECFLCKRNEVRYQYFQDYNNLEQHFSEAHFACTDSACQAQKFVVFDSELDLNAHRLDVHSANMSPKDRKEARRVQLHSREAENVAPRRSRGEVEGFLMSEGTLEARYPSPSSRGASARSPVLESLKSESSAHDLISTIWNVLGQNMEDTENVINAVIDFLGEEEKKYDLLAAWIEYEPESESTIWQYYQSYDHSTCATSHYADVTSAGVPSAARATTWSPQADQLDRRVAQPANPSPLSSPIVSKSNVSTIGSIDTSELGAFPSLVRPRANSKATPQRNQSHKSKSWASVAAPSYLPSLTTSIPKRVDQPRLPFAATRSSPPAAGPSFDTNVTPAYYSPQSPHAWASLASTDLSAWTPSWNTEGGSAAISGTAAGEGRKGKGKQKQRVASASFSL